MKCFPDQYGWERKAKADYCSLELGTGTGVSTASLLNGMDPAARLVSVDQDPKVQGVARKHLGGDPRCTFVEQDAPKYLASARDSRFDLVFADAWPGKFTHLDDTLSFLAPSGFYVVDDLQPQPNWPEGHQPLVSELIRKLEGRSDLHVLHMDWATGSSRRCAEVA